jgi:hypothetical protein
MLKKIIFLSVFGLATTAMTAFATPVCSSGVTDNGTTYFGGGYSCTIGDLLFSNFSYTPSGTNPISAGQITVNAVTNDGIGLAFHAPWSAAAGMTTDGTIDFEVTVLGGGSVLEDFGLAQTSGVSGDGSASVAENGCGPAPCLATGGSIYVLTFQDSGARSAQGETTFSPVNSVEVEKDISVNGNSGFATISVVQDTFSQVPEPLSMGLMGGGLALLGLSRLRRRSKKA